LVSVELVVDRNRLAGTRYRPLHHRREKGMSGNEQEVSDLEAKLKVLTEDNTKIMQEHQIGLDDISILRLWVTALIDTVVGTPNTPVRLQYEITLQEKTREILNAGVSQAVRQRLLQGVNLNNPPPTNGFKLP
jgi:hypothetical protein